MFDVNRFSQKLNVQLTGRAEGYQYAIYEGEILSSSGAAGYAVIPSQKKMTPDTRMTVASMSKTITATALMRAIEIVNAAIAGTNVPQVSIASKISFYLPADWTQGPFVKEMTFKDLLTHRSGLRSIPEEEGANDEDLFEKLRQTIANGSAKENWQVYEYENCNFAMHRILIPNLLYGLAASKQPDLSGLQAELKALQAELEVASPAEKALLAAKIKVLNKQIQALEPPNVHTAKLFFEFVREQVLGRVGLGDVSLAPTGPAEAIEYYDFNNPSNVDSGHDFNWLLLRNGSGHWFMSAKEYGRFISGLRNGKIISNNLFLQMTSDLIGMGVDDSTRGGNNWDHSGGFGPAGMEGDWMILPNGITAVILSNRPGGLKKSLQDIIRNAFNATWLSPATTNVAPAGTSLSNRLHVFIKGEDNRVYVNSALAGESFGGWMEVEGHGVTGHALAAAPLGNRVYVFGTGMTKQAYVNSAIAGQPFDGWGQGWTTLPGATTDAAPAAASVGNRIFVFLKGLDNRLYVNSALDGQAFAGWKEVEGHGTTDVAPGAAPLGGRIYVFAKGAIDKKIYVNSAIAGQPFDGWGQGWTEVQE